VPRRIHWPRRHEASTIWFISLFAWLLSRLVIDHFFCSSFSLTSLFSVYMSHDVLSLYHYFLFAVLLLFSTIVGWILRCKSLSSYLVPAMSLTHGAPGKELIYIIVLFATSMSAVSLPHHFVELMNPRHRFDTHYCSL
jgi:hypothetical protein